MANEKQHGHPMFYELLEQMAALHSCKNHDYSGTEEPLKNLKSSVRLGVDPVLAVLVRLQDKWSRLEEFAKKGVLEVKDESIEDTLMDNAVYSLLAIVLRREQKKQPEDLLTKEAWTGRFSSNESIIEHVPKCGWQIRLANGKFLWVDINCLDLDKAFTESTIPYCCASKESAELYLIAYLETLKCDST